MSVRREALTALHGSMMGWRAWGCAPAGLRRVDEYGTAPVSIGFEPITLAMAPSDAYWLKDAVAFVWRVADAARGGVTWLDAVRAHVLIRGVA